MSDSPPRAKAGYWQLTFMIYGAVCGGAFGIESMVSGSGPGLAILISVAMPFIFSIPISLAVAELTAAFPVEGGNYRWSRMALGDFWGFQAAWWAWMTGMVTNSSFAVLFADYLRKAEGLSDGQHLAVRVALIAALFWLNVRGIDLVGNTSIALSVLLLAPFAALIAIGFTHWSHSPITPFIPPQVSMNTAVGSGLVLGIWLYSGYDKLSSVAEEVEEPQRVFPRALLSAATLAMLSYVIPVVAALAYLGDWDQWKDQYFLEVARKMGGQTLFYAMTFSALCSNALLLNVTQLSASRVPLAAARDGLMPRWLTLSHSRFGTPWLSLLVGSFVTLGFTYFTFEQIVIIYAWFQMASNLLVYANVYVLRRTHADTPRPFRLPGGTPGWIACTLPTVLIAVIAIRDPIWKDGQLVTPELQKGLLAFASGPIFYYVCRLFSSAPAPSAQK